MSFPKRFLVPEGRKVGISSLLHAHYVPGEQPLTRCTWPSDSHEHKTRLRTLKYCSFEKCLGEGLASENAAAQGDEISSGVRQRGGFSQVPRIFFFLGKISQRVCDELKAAFFVLVEWKALFPHWLCRNVYEISRLQMTGKNGGSWNNFLRAICFRIMVAIILDLPWWT